MFLQNVMQIVYVSGLSCFFDFKIKKGYVVSIMNYDNTMWLIQKTPYL